jgi:hypothetical protein
MKPKSPQTSKVENYLDFQYPETAYLIEPTYELALDPENLPPISKKPEPTASISVLGNLETAETSIDLSLLFADHYLTIGNSRTIFQDESVVKGAKLKTPRNTLRISQALYTHSLFLKMFAHHPREFGLTSKIVNGMSVSTAPQHNINDRYYGYGDSGNKTGYKFLVETLEIGRYHEYKNTYVHNQMPLQYTSLSYGWFPEESDSELYGTLFMVPVIYNPNHSNLECQKQKHTMPDDTHHELCPDTDLYWAIGQVGIKKYMGHAKWNDIKLIKEFVERLRSKESRRNSLVVAALTDAKAAKEGKESQEVRSKLNEAREAFKGKTIKPGVLGSIIKTADLEDKRKHTFIDLRHLHNIYYSSKYNKKDTHGNTISPKVYADPKPHGLTLEGKAKDTIELSKIYACMEIAYESNISSLIDIAEDTRRRKAIIKEVAHGIKIEGAKNLGDIVIVGDFDKAYIVRDYDLFCKYKSLFGVKESAKTKILPLDEALTLDTTESKEFVASLKKRIGAEGLSVYPVEWQA